MKFLLDHDVPDDLSSLLRQLEHDVTLLREVLPRTASDAEILEYAFQNGHLLVQPRRLLPLARTACHHGIIVIVRRRTRVAERAAFLRLLEEAGPSGLANNFTFA